MESSTPELKLVPGRRRRQLEQRAFAAGLEVGELRGPFVPGHVEPAVLDAWVEPAAAEDELPQPVDERLALDQREPLPVTHEIPAELAPRLLDHAVRGQLAQVLGLVRVELVLVHEPKSERRRADALGEVGGVEAEAEPQELDDDVVARRVVVRIHAREDSPGPRLHCVSTRAAIASGLVTAGLVLAVVWVFAISLSRAALLAPVIVCAAVAGTRVLELWAKVGWEALRRRHRPWLVAGIALAAFAAIAVLSLLGLELPRE